MNLPKLGHAVIVNNVSKEIPGSNTDVAALKTAFDMVGFEVHVHSNCNSQVNCQTCLQRNKKMCSSVSAIWPKKNKKVVNYFHVHDNLTGNPKNICKINNRIDIKPHELKIYTQKIRCIRKSDRWCKNLLWNHHVLLPFLSPNRINDVCIKTAQLDNDMMRYSSTNGAKM